MTINIKDARTPAVTDTAVRNILLQRLNEVEYLSPAWWAHVKLLEGEPIGN